MKTEERHVSQTTHRRRTLRPAFTICAALATTALSPAVAAPAAG